MIIPFFIPHAGCPHRCVFCDQERITGHLGRPDPETVPVTIRSYLAGHRPNMAGLLQKRKRRRTTGIQVAFFGGSFTALPPAVQEAYLAAVQPFIASQDITGIRVSTRPDGITPDILAFLKSFRVSTVELGVQSMDDEVLRRSGRGHTSADTRRAVRLLREQGFTAGVQLMPGLPGDTAATFRRTVDDVVGLAPAVARVYPALVLRDTPLEKLYREGSYRPLSLDDAVAWCADALARFRQAGIEVIRMGLQPTEDLTRPGTIVAGPWHPAFGQLVVSRSFLAMMRRLLSANKFDLLVHPDDLSTALGQRRENLAVLAAEFGQKVRVIPDPSIPRGDVVTRIKA
jgi:histone acetyltransferase (RNA polymerase elongator complex component)